MALPISAATAQSLCDSIANHIIQSQALIGSSAGLVAGQATTLSHISALADAAQEYVLLGAFESAVSAENGWLAQIQAYNAILDLFFSACASLDVATGGLPAFLAANSIQVDPHFLDAFNRAANRAVAYPKAPLSAYESFGPAIANMGKIAVTGTTAGTYSAGTPVPAAYGNTQLNLTNGGVGNTGASSTVVQITYNAYNGSGVLQTGLTANATMPNGSAPGASVPFGQAGVAITAIAVTAGGNNGDTLQIAGTLKRVAAY